MDREKVVAWLTEISLRPCDFTTDDFDDYETEYLANEALEICEAAKVFNKQRNDALAMLKNQEPVDIEIEGGGNSWWYVCEECRGAVDTSDRFCRHCGRPFRKRKCAGCKDDCPQTGNFVCHNGKL